MISRTYYPAGFISGGWAVTGAHGPAPIWNNGTILRGVSGLEALACSASQTSITKLDSIAEFKHLSHVSPFLDHLSLQTKSDLKGVEIAYSRWREQLKPRANNIKTEALLVSMVGGQGLQGLLHFLPLWGHSVTPSRAKHGHEEHN